MKAGSLFAQWLGAPKGSAPGPVGPAPSADAEWLEAALRVSLATFGEPVEVRPRGVEGGVKAACSTAAQASAAAEVAMATGTAAAQDAAAALSEVRRHDAAMDEMQRQLAAMKVDIEAVANRPNVEGPSSAEKCVARVANLAWGTEESVLVSRARETLQRVGVPDAAYPTVAPMITRTRLGSAAEVWFSTEKDLAFARLAVRAARQEYVQGRPVWLDRKQTKEESAPIRGVHRLEEFVRDLEAGRSDTRQVTKDIGHRSALIGGQRAAFVAGRYVRWTAVGEARIGAPERELAAAFAEAA